MYRRQIVLDKKAGQDKIFLGIYDTSGETRAPRSYQTLILSGNSSAEIVRLWVRLPSAGSGELPLVSNLSSLAFFSYSRHDSEFVLKLATHLRAAGAGLWLDQIDIRAGQLWDSAVAEALGRSTLLLVVLSPDSVNSNNVMDEVSFALEKKKTVIPVLYKPCEVPFRLRRTQYADFTVSYEEGLAALLRALEVEPLSPSAQPPPLAPPPKVEKIETAVKRAPDPITSGGTKGTDDAKPWISRGKLVAGLVGLVLLGIIIWWANTRNPSKDSRGSLNSLTETTANLDGKTKASGGGAGTTAQATPRPSAAWVRDFLVAEQGPSTDALRPFFDDVVSPYYRIQSVGWAEIAEDKRSYFQRFPAINYTLVGEPSYHARSQDDGELEFEIDYSETRSDGKQLEGRTRMSLSVRSVAGQWKIASITEQKVY